MPDSIYQQYEQEKRRIQALNLPYDEYQKRIKDLANKLGV